MHIGIVSEYVRPWPGGISEHVFHEAAELRARGHEVSVLSGPHDAPCADPALIRLPWSVEFESNGARSRVSLGPQLAYLRRFLRGLACDVLHVHAPLDPLLALSAVLAAPCPVLGTFHASFEPAALWELLFRGFAPLTKRAFSRLAVRIAVSEQARRSIAHYFPGTYSVIPNGVDLERFSPAPGDQVAASADLLFVGRADARKGLPLLLDAFARVRVRRPRLTLRLVGVTESELARLGGAVAGVEALGYVAPSALPALYRAARLLCAPSLYGESQGVVLLEAMASAVPIVCFDIPGYRDLVHQAETAWLVRERSAPALAAGIEEALESRDLTSSARVLGPERAQAYAWPAVAARIEQALHHALGDPALSDRSRRSRSSSRA